MKPRPLPEKFQSAWPKWPTFDDVRAQYPKAKVHTIRAALAAVPCYRCPDQSARYLPDRAGEAMLQLKDLEDDDEFDEEEIAELEEAADPKRLSGLSLFRESMKLVQDLRNSFQTLSRESMEPLKLGLQLVREQNENMRSRLAYYEGVDTRLIKVLESLLSEEHQRKLAATREEQQAKMREKMFGMASAHLPKLISQFKPTVLASVALDAVKALEFDVVEAIATAETNTPEQREAWTKLIQAMKAGAGGGAGPQQAEQNDQGVNHQPPS